MRLFFPLLGAATILAAGAAQPARAQETAVNIATYVDVMPNATASGSALLARYRDASRKEASNLRFDVLQEIGRPNRFAIVAAWKDKGALDAHVKSASTEEFLDRLKAVASAPADDRVATSLYATRANGAAGIFVLTHVDVTPPNKDDCMALLKTMSADTAKDAGAVSYEVLQQANRSNHFTVVEAWKTTQALTAHAAAAHTRAFREKLAPMAGALYDERFYRLLGRAARPPGAASAPR